MKQPVLLARNNEIAVMIIGWCHEKVAHSGRSITMNYIGSSGFWILNCNAAVRSYISKCVTCRHIRGNLVSLSSNRFFQEKMVSFSSDRLCEDLVLHMWYRPISTIFDQGKPQGAKGLWSFIHMVLQRSHPH